MDFSISLDSYWFWAFVIDNIVLLIFFLTIKYTKRKSRFNYTITIYKKTDVSIGQVWYRCTFDFKNIQYQKSFGKSAK